MLVTGLGVETLLISLVLAQEEGKAGGEFLLYDNRPGAQLCRESPRAATNFRRTGATTTSRDRSRPDRNAD